jgi:hypothetical protein
MSAGRHFDTVAFDVQDNATMLFFARTDEAGDIEDYLLLMRTIGDDFDDTIFLEVNEEQYSGSEIIREARMSENMLTLFFSEPVAVFGGETELVIAFSDSPENRASMEAGAFRVLGEKIAGGNA